MVVCGKVVCCILYPKENQERTKNAEPCVGMDMYRLMSVCIPIHFRSLLSLIFIMHVSTSSGALSSMPSNNPVQSNPATSQSLPSTKMKYVWRFGYGSNIGLSTLKQKKNLNPSKYLVGTIKSWQLYFMPGIQHVEPGWAAIRPHPDGVNGELHGSAFLIPEDEAAGLDRQERGYDVLSCKFQSYDGEIVEDVGLYVPKKGKSTVDEGTPSLRYLRLLRNGAREGKLSPEWVSRLDSFEHYVTPLDVRSKTLQWIEDFDTDPARKGSVWSMEKLTQHDGSDPSSFPPHTSVMEYVVKIGSDCWVFPSWRGHSVTRRNLLQFNGKSLDTNDIRHSEPGFRPLPKMDDCSEEEKEYLMQNLESLLHRGSKIVARLQPFLDDQALFYG